MSKKYLGNYIGIIIGGLYGILMRILFGQNFNGIFADLFSITFVWILPIIIGLTTLLFYPKENTPGLGAKIIQPVLAVLTFFLLCYFGGLEDLISILIISIPFLMVAAISGILFGGIFLRNRQRRGIFYILFFIPVIAGLIEPVFRSSSESYENISSIIINADKQEIWNNIVRVNEIDNKEYEKGFFNTAGIPKPLYAELDKDTLGGTRIGHFEGGLKFKENIIEWHKDSIVTFDIKIIPSTSTRTIFERHMLNSEHFTFLNATYRLKHITSNKTELSLITKYQLVTKINFYGEYWGQQLLKDFQDRLLKVIKTRCEI